ncbi:hypothetical protein MishRS11D_02980 [Methylomagnum ishizawai]|nr:hypothetical protein MishRS11D_02980 [Methylomagnum ishizawai]
MAGVRQGYRILRLIVDLWHPSSLAISAQVFPSARASLIRALEMGFLFGTYTRVPPWVSDNCASIALVFKSCAMVATRDVC